MIRTTVALALLSCLPATLFAGSQGSSAPHDQEAIREVVDLERQSKDAAIRRDVSFVERTLAEDYVGIGPLGAVVTKADTVAARKAAQLHYDSIEISEMLVRVFGNTAVVTARAEVRGNQLGEDFSGPYRFTRVWVKRNGHWQTVSYQATVTR